MAAVSDLLDAPTALAACCGVDLCHKHIWYLVVEHAAARRHARDAGGAAPGGPAAAPHLRALQAAVAGAVLSQAVLRCALVEDHGALVVGARDAAAVPARGTLALVGKASWARAARCGERKLRRYRWGALPLKFAYGARCCFPAGGHGPRGVPSLPRNYRGRSHDVVTDCARAARPRGGGRVVGGISCPGLRAATAQVVA